MAYSATSAISVTQTWSGNLLVFPLGSVTTASESMTDGCQRRPNLSLAAERYLDVGRGRGGPVPPRAGRAARSRVPRGERRGAADGVAAHPASGLARRRRGRGGGRLRRVRRSGPGAGRAARLGHARARRHDGRAADRGRRGRRAVDHGRRQHGRRRLRADGGLGPLRAGRGRHAGPGPRRRAPYTADERAALGEAARTLGDTTFDVHLNGRAYWRNVPAAVWGYKLGGYQVLKKWLSYREQLVLGRALKPEEVQHFTDTARRIGAILQLVQQK